VKIPATGYKAKKDFRNDAREETTKTRGKFKAISKNVAAAGIFPGTVAGDSFTL